MENIFETQNDFCNEHGVFHRCKLNGNDYFFTDERIKDEDMPQGWYRADIRAKMCTNEWASIEPLVAFDHIATIISDKPITFGSENLIRIDSCELEWDEEVINGLPDDDDEEE